MRTKSVASFALLSILLSAQSSFCMTYGDAERQREQQKPSHTTTVLKVGAGVAVLGLLGYAVGLGIHDVWLRHSAQPTIEPAQQSAKEPKKQHATIQDLLAANETPEAQAQSEPGIETRVDTKKKEPASLRISRWIARHPGTMTFFCMGAGAGLGVLSRRNTFARTAMGAAAGGVAGLYTALAIKDSGRGGKFLPCHVSDAMVAGKLHAISLSAACLGALGAIALGRSGSDRAVQILMGAGGALVGLQAATLITDRAQVSIFNEEHPDLHAHAFNFFLK